MARAPGGQPIREHTDYNAVCATDGDCSGSVDPLSQTVDRTVLVHLMDLTVRSNSLDVLAGKPSAMEYIKVVTMLSATVPVDSWQEFVGDIPMGSVLSHRLH